MMKTILMGGAILGLASMAAAADSPWTGHWKLDPAKSHFTGSTITYSQGPLGLLHFSDGSTTDYDFGLDGKEYATVANRTTSWTPAGNGAWDQVTKADGKVLAKSHRVLSKDGQTLTMTFSGVQPDGKTFSEEDIYTRVSGSNGLVGTWRSTKMGPNAPLAFIISLPEPDTLRYEVPEQKVTVQARADGTDVPLTGPNMAPGMTIGFKLAGNTISYAIKMNGKADTLGVETLSADGRSFSDVSWSPGKENEKQTAVYVKQ